MSANDTLPVVDGATRRFEVAFFESAKDNRPKRQTLTFAELKQRLFPYRASAEKDGPAWAPVRFKAGGKRGNRDVEAISVAVFDLDHGNRTEIDACTQALEREGVASIIHSTYSHTEEKPSLRLLIDLSRDVLPSEWPDLRTRLIERFKIPADPATKDLARIYFLPTVRQ